MGLEIHETDIQTGDLTKKGLRLGLGLASRVERLIQTGDLTKKGLRPPTRISELPAVRFKPET